MTPAPRSPRAMCGTEGGRRCPNRSRPTMPKQKQPEADQPPTQAASATRLELVSSRQIHSNAGPGIRPQPQPPILHRIPTIQVSVPTSKTAKLVSNGQIAEDTSPTAFASTPPHRSLPAVKPRPGPGKAQISTRQIAESNPQTPKMVSSCKKRHNHSPATPASSCTPRRAPKTLADLGYTVARSGGETPLAEIRS